jgi:hypothetical protein
MPLPTPRDLRRQFKSFGDSLKLALETFLDDAENDNDANAVYRSAVAARNVLINWRNEQPNLLESAAGAAVRSINLICIRQYSLFYVELRRFIECVTWFLYFAEHPVEWEIFRSNPGRGSDTRREKPIESAAFSTINQFFAYAKERMATERSGLATRAIDTLRTQYGALSSYVHGAKPALDGTLALAHDRFDRERCQEMARASKVVFGQGCILLVTYRPILLTALSTTDREWFDKLVGRRTSEIINNGVFGL